MKIPIVKLNTDTQGEYQYRYPKSSIGTLCFKCATASFFLQVNIDTHSPSTDTYYIRKSLISIGGLTFESKDLLLVVRRSRKWQDLKNVTLSRVLLSSKEKPTSN
ncbi:hypothetical protein V6N11_043188 [Hibiscus sabdariffa]|uniref:Uncharacterized protein n=1 Tax=Hibiscus sabdariffa TaxID=183260 RepID=A0ABR2QYT2_9ROSI